MRIAIGILGLLAILAGAIFIAQGLNYFPYPAKSFMIGDSTWAYRGAALVIAGLVLVVLARRAPK